MQQADDTPVPQMEEKCSAPSDDENQAASWFDRLSHIPQYLTRALPGPALETLNAARRFFTTIVGNRYHETSEAVEWVVSLIKQTRDTSQQPSGDPKHLAAAASFNSLVPYIGLDTLYTMFEFINAQLPGSPFWEQHENPVSPEAKTDDMPPSLQRNGRIKRLFLRYAASQLIEDYRTLHREKTQEIAELKAEKRLLEKRLDEMDIALFPQQRERDIQNLSSQKRSALRQLAIAKRLRREGNPALVNKESLDNSIRCLQVESSTLDTHIGIMRERIEIWHEKKQLRQDNLEHVKQSLEQIARTMQEMQATIANLETEISHFKADNTRLIHLLTQAQKKLQFFQYWDDNESPQETIRELLTDAIQHTLLEEPRVLPSGDVISLSTLQDIYAAAHPNRPRCPMSKQRLPRDIKAVPPHRFVRDIVRRAHDQGVDEALSAYVEDGEQNLDAVDILSLLFDIPIMSAPDTPQPAGPEHKEDDGLHHLRPQGQPRPNATP